MDMTAITFAHTINNARTSNSEDAYYAANAPKRLHIPSAISAVAALGLVVIAALGVWPA